MSTNLAERRPSIGWIGRTEPRPETEERPSHLEVVSSRSQRRARPRAAYAVVAIATLFAIVVAQLLLSIAISQGAYQLSSLSDTQTRLQRSYQAASEDLNRVASPQNLAANANALGMVSNSNPAYLRLSDGAVLGAPIAASTVAGTVTGSTGNLVPNSLLKGVPLAVHTNATNAAKAAAAAKSAAKSAVGSAAGKAGSSASTSVPKKAAPQPTVPLDGALPTPVTH